MTPVISIVVAVYNGEKVLQRCIDSVRSQSYLNVELIIMDGGSTDGTIEILERNDDVIAYWESKPDSGISHAWNKALEHISGDWVLFLGADDYLWESSTLEKVSPHLSVRQEEGRVVYGQVALVSEDDRVIKLAGREWSQIKDDFMKRNILPHQGVFHNKEVFIDNGGFDQSLKIAADYDLLLRELHHRSALFIPGVVIAGMQIGGLSTSASTRLLTISEFIIARNKRGFTKVPLILRWMQLKAIIKKTFLNIR